MLVRKLKCHTCGASKINEINTGYIYCDYCAHFMGYDFEMMSSEATDIYDHVYFAQHGKWPPQVQEYMDIMTAMGPAAEAKDAETYINLMVDLMNVQMDLFPKSHSPRNKIADYRKKYLAFYRAMLNERHERGKLFLSPDVTAMFENASTKIKMETGADYKTYWIYDENLEAYFDVVSNYSKQESDEMMTYKCLDLYPEEVSPNYADLVYKQTVYGYTKLLNKESFKKVMEYLGLTEEYEDLSPPDLIAKDCGGCGSQMEVPDGAKKKICEFCGNENLLETGKVTCVNCGAGMSADEAQNKNECSYCGSKNKVMQF